MIFYNRQYITKSDIKNVTKSLSSNYITKGPFQNKFEKRLCKVFKSKYCLVTSNATSSFYIIAKILKWRKGNNIIVSPLNFVAAANSIVSTGARPIFVDIKDSDQNLDPILVENKIKELKKKKKKVNAIIVTDYAGTPADWKKFYEIKKKYKLILINDNCHAIGSKYYNEIGYAVKYADIVIHSYHAVKNITSGEGGSILTNNKEIYFQSKKIREHGFYNIKSKKKWERQILNTGFNSRLSELNCALGYSQLKRLKSIINKRVKIAKFYDNFFKNYSYINIRKTQSFIKSSFHLYNLRINFKLNRIDKIKFYKILSEKFGIILQVHYIPTYKFHLFKKYVNKKKIKNDFPNTENYYEQTFSIPLYLGLNKKKLMYICRSIINTIIIPKNGKK